MIVLTKKKIDEIVQEIDELSKSRETLIVQLNEAIQLGDLSENAEYIEAKKKLAENNRRSLKLNNILKNEEIADEGNKTQKDYIDIFATVKIENLENNSISNYMLVDEEESSLLEDKISITSPIGKLLKNKKKNDIIEIVLNNIKRKYKIIDIAY